MNLVAIAGVPVGDVPVAPPPPDETETYYYAAAAFFAGALLGFFVKRAL